MLRAMDSAISGLRAHQNKLDVIGHNIANVNTFGFKAQSYSFKEASQQAEFKMATQRRPVQTEPSMDTAV